MTVVTVIPGDGVGPEVVDATLTAIRATGAVVTWDFRTAGRDAIQVHGSAIPAETIESVRRTGLALKGPLATPVGSRWRSLNGFLRKELDLYAAVRPCRSFNARTGRTDCDLVIVRENHEDVFMGIEFPRGHPDAGRLRELVHATHRRVLPADAGVSLRPISTCGTERVVRAAFEHASSAGRRKVTVGHKANVMLATDLLFLEVARKVADEFEHLEYEEVLIDTLCGRMVLDPSGYDVIVLPNLFGDIVSDIGAALVGGTGMAPGVNLGPGCAVFEAVHGVADRLAGRDMANPTGLILSGALLLRHIGETDAADVLERATHDVLADHATYDQRPSGAATGTYEFGQLIAAQVRRMLDHRREPVGIGGARD